MEKFAIDSTAARVPVHVFYGGAHLFRQGLFRKMGERALGLPGATELGMMLGDEFRARRLARLPRLANRVAAEWTRMGVTPPKLPDTFAAAYVEAATLVDESRVTGRQRRSRYSATRVKGKVSNR